MTEYCTAEDVRKRLTDAGYKFFADLDQNATVGTTEVANTITPAIAYAGNKIDAMIIRIGCQVEVARGAGNAWLRDRAIDIAAYRVSSTGGGGTIAVLKEDAVSALDDLKSVTQVPGLKYNYPFDEGAKSHRGPMAINVRRRRC